MCVDVPCQRLNTNIIRGPVHGADIFGSAFPSTMTLSETRQIRGLEQGNVWERFFTIILLFYYFTIEGQSIYTMMFLMGILLRMTPEVKISQLSLIQLSVFFVMEL